MKMSFWFIAIFFVAFKVAHADSSATPASSSAPILLSGSLILSPVELENTQKRCDEGTLISCRKLTLHYATTMQQEKHTAALHREAELGDKASAADVYYQNVTMGIAVREARIELLRLIDEGNCFAVKRVDQLKDSEHQEFAEDPKPSLIVDKCREQMKKDAAVVPGVVSNLPPNF